MKSSAPNEPTPPAAVGFHAWRQTKLTPYREIAGLASLKTTSAIHTISATAPTPASVDSQRMAGSPIRSATRIRTSRTPPAGRAAGADALTAPRAPAPGALAGPLRAARGRPSGGAGV